MLAHRRCSYIIASIEAVLDAAARAGTVVLKTKTKTRGTSRSANGDRGPAAMKHTQFLAINRAISDPTRYEILQRIAREKQCTCAQLRECSPVTPATLSHHLKELEDAGLIKIDRRGKFAYPSFCRDVWKTYLDQLSEL